MLYPCSTYLKGKVSLLGTPCVGVPYSASRPLRFLIRRFLALPGAGFDFHFYFDEHYQLRTSYPTSDLTRPPTAKPHSIPRSVQTQYLPQTSHSSTCGEVVVFNARVIHRPPAKYVPHPALPVARPLSCLCAGPFIHKSNTSAMESSSPPTAR